jgi:hypothetical protein
MIRKGKRRIYPSWIHINAMLSLAGDESSTDIMFMSIVAKEQQGYEQIVLRLIAVISA